MMLESTFSMEAGEETAATLPARRQPPTAIFAVNGNTAIGVIAAARRLRRDIPHDLSVVGYNDTPIAAQMPDPLTTIRVPIAEVAITEVTLLREAHSRSSRSSDSVSAPALAVPTRLERIKP
jgi:LacI family transcriptional regulator